MPAPFRNIGAFGKNACAFPVYDRTMKFSSRPPVERPRNRAQNLFSRRASSPADVTRCAHDWRQPRGRPTPTNLRLSAYQPRCTPNKSTAPPQLLVARQGPLIEPGGQTHSYTRPHLHTCLGPAWCPLKRKKSGLPPHTRPASIPHTLATGCRQSGINHGRAPPLPRRRGKRFA